MNTPATALIATQDRTELIKVLGASLYVGARPESISLVLDYCAAAGLDPMQKPVHIVPMNTKDPVTGKYEWRDVIMPGIGHYRIQADRAGTMAGISEPEFGDDITQDLHDKNGNVASYTYPEWCRIAVKKLVGNNIVEFVAKEYWIENYASAGQATAPNAMWNKRPRGQIAKCAEAQALRKAFPELGAQPTAEEMEGKIIDMGDAEIITKQSTSPKVLPEYADADFDKNLPQWKSLIQSGKNTAEQIITKVSMVARMTEAQINKLNDAAVIDVKTEPSNEERDSWLADYEGTNQ